MLPRSSLLRRLTAVHLSGLGATPLQARSSLSPPPPSYMARSWLTTSSSSSSSSSSSPPTTSQDKFEVYNGYMPPRTTVAGQIGPDDDGKQVSIAGWLASSRRVNARLSFHSLRDSTGTIQLKYDVHGNNPLMEIPLESVIHIEGRIVARPREMTPFSDTPASSMEVVVEAVRILNLANPKLPFYPVEHDLPKSEEMRIQHRHIDLRRTSLTDNIRLRGRLSHSIRNYLFDQGFLEVDTPLLLRSTPEGAREFLVPTRYPAYSQEKTEVTQGSDASSARAVTQLPTFYALPQSPQQPKQILMASGVTDKYYQFARCFRDESGRKDRQPEFTQIDMEMAFISGHHPSSPSHSRFGSTEVTRVVEGMVRKVWKEAKGVDVPPEFKVMTYNEAMTRYGVDKPDLRFGLEIVNLGAGIKKHSFKAEGTSAPSAKTTAGLLEIVAFRSPKAMQAISREEALLYTRHKSGGPGKLERFKSDKAPRAIAEMLILRSNLLRSYVRDIGMDAEEVDVDALAEQISLALEKGNFNLPGVGDGGEVGSEAQYWMQRREAAPVGDSTELGDLRLRLRDVVLHKGWATLPSEPKFVWIIDFPLFTQADEDKAALTGGRWASTHHPFTAPKPEHLPALMRVLDALKAALPKEQEQVLSKYAGWLKKIEGMHYDLVVDGVELGGGSVRIHSADLQREVLQYIHQLQPGEVSRFAPLLEALSSGCPPHAGIALGFDRMVSLLTKRQCESIRDVIAFPKIGPTGRDPFFRSPNTIGDDVEVRTRLASKVRKMQSNLTEDQLLRARAAAAARNEEDNADKKTANTALEEDDEGDEDDDEDVDDDEDYEDYEEEQEGQEQEEDKPAPPLTVSAEDVALSQYQEHLSHLQGQETHESLQLRAYGLKRYTFQEEEHIEVMPRFRKISRARAKRTRREEAKRRASLEEEERRRKVELLGFADPWKLRRER